MTQPSDSSTLESDEFARRPPAPAARPAPAREVEAPPAAPPIDDELEDEAEEDEDDLDEEEEADDSSEEEASSPPPPPWKIGAAIRGASSLFTSLIVHLAVLVGLALWMQPEIIKPVVHEVVSRLEERPKDDLKVELDERFDPQTNVDRTSSSAFVPQVGMSDGGGPLGATGSGGATAMIKAPEYDASVRAAVEAGEITIDAPLSGAPAPSKMIAATPDGALGNPRAIVDNYQQAMDQITQEIVWFMDKSNVLVVWCFDQSESMKDDQQEIRERIERVYAELGLTAHEANRLTTAVASYGSGFALHTPTPTSDRNKIRAAIDAVPVDPSGQEMMCEAVGRSIAHHREYAQKTGRQMLLILVTDESGDVPNNNSYLEQAIAEAKAAKCRCYVLGREAVFGYPYAYISWQHPQTKHVHWLQIDRGPETAFVEQLQTDGFHRRYDAHPSGFGPYEQTRLSRETGGIFFMLPSLESNLVHGEKRRYELEKMRAYRPDLRARIAIVSERDESLLRRTVWKVIYDLNPYQPDIAQIIEMRVHFSPQYTLLVPEARHEQAKAIVYLEYLARMQKIAEKIAKARDDEPSPRWQANYDLIYAQLIAYQARMYEYGAYLEYFIKNPKVVPATKDPNLTHVYWDIRTREKTLTKESVPYIEKATQLYEQIIKDHPGTPWAARAELELKRGFGVELIEHYEPPYPVIPPGTVLKPIPKL